MTPAYKSVSGVSYILSAVRQDTDCAANSYGEVAGYFAGTPCVGLSRGLFAATADGRQILVSVSVSVVRMPDAATATALRALAGTDATGGTGGTGGTGNVNDLVSSGVTLAAGPTEVTGAYALSVADREVRIGETAWLDPSGAGTDAALAEAATRALDLVARPVELAAQFGRGLALSHPAEFTYLHDRVNVVNCGR